MADIHDDGIVYREEGGSGIRGPLPFQDTPIPAHIPAEQAIPVSTQNRNRDVFMAPLEEQAAEPTPSVFAAAGQQTASASSGSRSSNSATGASTGSTDDTFTGMDFARAREALNTNPFDSPGVFINNMERNFRPHYVEHEMRGRREVTGEIITIEDPSPETHVERQVREDLGGGRTGCVLNYDIRVNHPDYEMYDNLHEYDRGRDVLATYDFNIHVLYRSNEVRIVISGLSRDQIECLKSFADRSHNTIQEMPPEVFQQVLLTMADEHRHMSNIIARDARHTYRHPQPFSIPSTSKACIKEAYEEHRQNKWKIVNETDKLEALFTELERVEYLKKEE